VRVQAIAEGLIAALERLQHRRGAALGEERQSSQARSAFESFLLAEYTNIAQAHFNTVDSLANFVKHYLFIASTPIYLLVIFADLTDINKSTALKFFSANPEVPVFVATAIWLIGFCVLGYLVNIRCDTLLYARTVNGIRNYFYNNAGVPLLREVQMRTLPKSIHLPEYREPGYFFFVVLMFALIATTYVGCAFYFYWQSLERLPGTYWGIIGASVLFHVGLYLCLTRHRERSYLRGNIVGVDIDGVLNDHRTHFCALLNTLTGKTLDPSSITHIPVHEMAGTHVTSADEDAIFNWPPYWHDMPVVDPNVGRTIRRIRNALGYQVWIFTLRGYPEARSIPQSKSPDYWQEWAKHSFLGCTGVVRALDWLERAVPWLLRGRLIHSITRRWLKKYDIEYNKLVIERGHTNRLDPLLHTRNRFLIARNRKMRAFVEDDLIKARKLAGICEVVFLMDQPYNQCESGSLPSNVIRVKSWQEVYSHLRELF
jgi:uncharacterized HAD superfamily protein